MRGEQLHQILIKLCQYELKSAFRSKMEYLNSLLFFIMIVSLLPFAWGGDQQQLQHIAPGGIWIAVLLASLLSMNSLFQYDEMSGHLDKLKLSSIPLAWLLFAKIVAHWCLTGLPVAIVAPVLGILFQLETKVIIVLMLSLVLGTPIMCFIGAMVSALTLGLQYRGLLLAVILLPLFIPILIFGSTAIQITLQTNQFPLAQISLLGAFLLFTLSLAPLVTASIVKIEMVN